jgi:hypothetical protein
MNISNPRNKLGKIINPCNPETHTLYSGECVEYECHDTKQCNSGFVCIKDDNIGEKICRKKCTVKKDCEEDEICDQIHNYCKFNPRLGFAMR